MRGFLLAITRDAVSLFGAAVTTASAVVILVLFGLGFVGFHGGPYLGIVTYLILPALFVVGLLLIPIGHWRHGRRTRRALARGSPPPTFPVIDLNLPRVRQGLLVFIAATVVNIAILALTTYKGVEWTDSTSFCGTACHVMNPEYTAYQRSSHARVDCVACHIGSGTGPFVRAKLAGVRQVVSVALGRYPRPIPAPVHDLRPAWETCEHCHRPGNFAGDRLKVSSRFAEDERNTERKTVAMLRIGIATETGDSQGIHWHADPRNRVRYRGTPDRSVIHEVELTRDGTTKRFTAPSAKSADAQIQAKDANEQLHAEDTGGQPPPEGEWRVMDCVDCHNRSAHEFRMPVDELDAALARGEIDRSLPFVKKKSLELLSQTYASHEEARRRIPEQLEAFYAAEYPDRLESGRDSVRSAGRTLAEIFCANAFPDMNVTASAFPSHTGHGNSPGCFRCHDDEHKTSEGRAISQDCALCHTLLAMEEENPEVLTHLQP